MGQWTNTAANDSLCAGVNNVTITDSLGCTLIDAVAIVRTVPIRYLPIALTLHAEAVTEPYTLPTIATTVLVL